jgi:hypothetical protein
MENPDPPIAEAISHAHTALLRDLKALEVVARRASTNGLETLRTRLETTRAHIVEHFRFEEEDGYMDAVRKLEPRLARAVEQLAEEHRQLLDSLDALRREIATMPSANEAVAAKVTSWVQKVQQHEARENHLVQDTFGLDIGTED